jgi:hypothetical protein
MAIIWFLLMMLAHVALWMLAIFVVFHLLGNVVGLFTQGVWRSPIEDRDAVWDWITDFWRDNLEPSGWAEKRRVRRRELGQCVMCGYSLIGNVSGTCPECGTATTYGANPGEPGES